MNGAMRYFGSIYLLPRRENSISKLLRPKTFSHPVVLFHPRKAGLVMYVAGMGLNDQEIIGGAQCM